MTLISNSEFLSCYSGPAAELQITEGPAFGRRSDLQISRAPMWNEDTSHRRSSRTICCPVPCCNSGRGFIPPGHVLHASRSSSSLWPMTTLSAQYDKLCFVGKGGHMVYLNREPVTSEPGKLYRPGYFLKFQQIVEGGLFFHFRGEGLEVEAAGPPPTPPSQAEKEVVRSRVAAASNAPSLRFIPFSGRHGTHGSLVPPVSPPFIYSPSCPQEPKKEELIV